MKVILTKLILMKEVHCAEYWEMVTTGFALQRLVKQAGSQTRRQDKDSECAWREGANPGRLPGRDRAGNSKQ